MLPFELRASLPVEHIVPRRIPSRCPIGHLAAVSRHGCAELVGVETDPGEGDLLESLNIRVDGGILSQGQVHRVDRQQDIGGVLARPGMDQPELTWQEQAGFVWDQTGFMRWPLALCVVVGIIVIIWKFFSLMAKSTSTRKILKEVDELLAGQRIDEALELTRESSSPAANILYAGLERHEEGTERVMKAIENQGLIELSKLEKGIVVLATLTNIGPLLGFLGTVIGMILAFQSIEAAGSVSTSLVWGGIKVALSTTLFGFLILALAALLWFALQLRWRLLETDETAAVA